MIIIKDRIYIEITIDGKPLDGPNLISSIALLEGCPVLAPSLSMVLNDHGGKLSKELVLTDANAIVVTIGKTPEDLKTVSRQYRSYKVKQLAGQSGPMLHVLALYDAPKYLLEAARESYEGTTDQVLQQIAEKCKLEFNGPKDFNGRALDDRQVWLNVAKSRAAFAQHELAKHAYMDEFSAMYASLTSLGQLRYRNLMDVIATPIEDVKFVIALNIMPGDQEFESKEVYLATKTKESSNAGVSNASGNYGSTLIQDGMSGETRVDSKLDVKTGAPYLAINDQVAQTVDRARVEYAPIDCGNTHPMYTRAIYQNKKKLALFSERLSVIVQDPTEIQLMDPVIYKQADADQSKPVRTTDIYVVIGKTIFVAGGQHYGERLELARMSIIEKGEAQLKSADPATARETSVPEVTIDPTVNVAASTLDKTRAAMRISGPMENAAKAVTASGGKVLNNVKLIQPSISRISANIKSYAEKPAQAAKEIRATANSVKQLKNTAKELQNNAKQMKDALKSGNAAMALAGMSTIAQTASYFRPDGVMSNICGAMGVTQVLKSTSEIYNTVATQLQTLRGPLDAIEGIGSEIDAVVNDMQSVVGSYTSVVGDLASSYNSAMEAVTGSTRVLNVPNLELNRTNFQSIIASSIAPATEPLTQVAYLVPTVDDVQTNVARNMLVKDDSRNYVWAPESNYVATRLSLDDLPNAVLDMSENIENATNQYEANLYKKAEYA